MALMVEWIEKKRNGEALPPSAIEEIALKFARGEIPDYQMASLLMAMYFRGLNDDETNAFTRSLWKSGITLKRAHRNDVWVDKHSTGGVGDKTSLMLAPLVSTTAARLFGEGQVRIPMISGRGLGFTGGTLDKLEAVKGFDPRIPVGDALPLLDSNGFFMMGQTGEIAPADKKIYALRDVTATVDFIPFIVSSIMSKKLAENLDGLVLDVKVGKGALMPDLTAAKHLAERLLQTGAQNNLAVTALLTRMDEPLGRFVGNFLEVVEAESFLRNQNVDPGLDEVTYRLGAWMLHFGSRKKLTLQACEGELRETVRTGSALPAFEKMFTAQKGDFSTFETRKKTLARKLKTITIVSPREGYLQELDPKQLGILLIKIGGGREFQKDKIDPLVGFEINKKVGDKVQKGEWILRAYVRERDLDSGIKEKLELIISVANERAESSSWIYKELGNESV